MLIFIAGLFVGSFLTIIIMSLMFAAKRGDQSLDVCEKKDKNEHDKKTK